MNFEWNAHKNEVNLAKHGVDFETARHIFDGPIIQREDTRQDYGETRFFAYGAVDGVVLFVVYTWRAGKRRLISARGASTEERRLYYVQIQD